MRAGDLHGTSPASTRRRPGGDRFAQALFYYAGDPRRRDLSRPGADVRDVERERGTVGNRLFYVSTPPSLYPHLVARLGEAGLNRPPEGSQGWVRIVIEKPFGRDLASSRALNQVVASAWSEDQVYRIDHYLGKETVQNILVFRWANGIFEPLWNRNHVDHVQITVGESIGIESRGAYYEESGALRDMIQKPHPAALVSGCHGAAGDLRRQSPCVTRRARSCARSGPSPPTTWIASPSAPSMAPASSAAGASRAIARSGGSRRSRSRRRTPRSSSPWTTGDGRACPSISAPASACPSGRARSLCSSSARRTSCSGGIRSTSPSPTSWSSGIQPDEGMSLSFGAKLPGSELRIKSVEMDFDYGQAFGGTPP